jgi:hypothetical protein
MANTRHVLGINFNRKAARMLVELVNMTPEPAPISKFVSKWEGLFGLQWPGSQSDFPETQRIIKSFWQGKKRGIESFQIGLSLGLEPHDGEPIKPPFTVDFETGGLYLTPHDLRQLLWLTLLQHARNLGICQHAGGHGWTHPYFIKYRREQKYCCNPCAAPAKREAKRRWWNQNRAK